MGAEIRDGLMRFVFSGEFDGGIFHGDFSGSMQGDVKEALREIDRLRYERDDLLAACECLIQWVVKDGQEVWAADHRPVALALAAVAKARGEVAP